MRKFPVQMYREFVVCAEDYDTAEQIVREQLDDVLRNEGTRAMSFENIEQNVENEEIDFQQKSNETF